MNDERKTEKGELRTSAICNLLGVYGGGRELSIGRIPQEHGRT
jgi:hypothetical protein